MLFLKILKYSIYFQIWKEHLNFFRKTYFHREDVNDDVTVQRQSRRLLFLYGPKHFYDSCGISRDIIVKLSVHMYHGYAIIPVNIDDDIIIYDVLMCRK